MSTTTTARGAFSPISRASNAQTPDPELTQLAATDPELDIDSEEEEDRDPQNPQSTGYRADSISALQIRPLNELIQSTHASYLKESPAPSRAEHNAIHRARFDALRAAAAADNTIPNALFSPPRTFVQVCVHEFPVQGHYCCPCDLDEHYGEALVDIRAPTGSTEGITADVFLQQLGDALYGEVFTVGDENDRPVIETLDYMISASSGVLMGHIWAMTRGV